MRSYIRFTEMCLTRRYVMVCKCCFDPCVRRIDGVDNDRDDGDGRASFLRAPIAIVMIIINPIGPPRARIVNSILNSVNIKSI